MVTNKKVLSGALLGLLAAGGTATVIFDQFLDEKEGNRLTAYPDGAGIYTICRGLTSINGRPVYKGMTLTAGQCAHYNGTERDKALSWINRNVTVPLNDAQKAGIASFCAYNIGTGKCQRSTFWRKLNSGDNIGACEEINRWIFDGGKDCRDSKNNCYGQIIRREQESALACWGINEAK